MRKTLWIVALAAGVASLLPGCGGGGASADAAAPQVQGKVVSRNGASSDLGGIEVTCENTGATVTTAADGSFVLEVPGGATVRVRFSDPLAAGLADGLPDCAESEDATPDAADVAEDSIEVETLQDGEVVTIEVELADGRVIECGVRRGEAGGVVVRCEGNLFPTDSGGPTFSLAEIEVTQDGDCATIEVEAEHLAPDQTLSLVLVAPGGEREVIATAEVDAGGVLHANFSTCAGDALPFGATTVQDLAGYGVLVEDGAGKVLLAGQVPGWGHEMGEDGFDDFPMPPGMPGGGMGGMPGFGDLPPPPTDQEIQDLLDLLEGLLGGGGFPGLPGGFPR